MVFILDHKTYFLPFLLDSQLPLPNCFISFYSFFASSCFQERNIFVSYHKVQFLNLVIDKIKISCNPIRNAINIHKWLNNLDRLWLEFHSIYHWNKWELLSTKLVENSRYSKQHIRVFRPHEEDEEYIWKEME